MTVADEETSLPVPSSWESAVEGSFISLSGTAAPSHQRVLRVVSTMNLPGATPCVDNVPDAAGEVGGGGDDDADAIVGGVDAFDGFGLLMQLRNSLQSQMRAATPMADIEDTRAKRARIV